MRFVCGAVAGCLFGLRIGAESTTLAPLIVGACAGVLIGGLGAAELGDRFWLGDESYRQFHRWTPPARRRRGHVRWWWRWLE